MSGSLAEMFVSLRPDGKKFQPEADRIIRRANVDRSGRSLGMNLSKSIGGGMRVGLGGAIKSAFGPIAAAAGAIGIGKFLAGAVTQASDLGETMSKSAAVFGSSNSIIQKFAATSAKSLGQTKQQAVGAAAQFGNMFNQLGIGQKQAATMSTQMVTLASDFASFHNADITEVLQAQEAAFRGEYDSIQKFVPTINAAAVEQEGMRLKLAGSTKELTAQDKALATQSLLMKGAGKAQGDFARTSGGLANQQRILSAQFSDFKTSIGQFALPLVTKFFTFLNDQAMPVLDELKGGITAFGAAWKFNDGDITSSGFPGFMERVGFVARQAFGYFQSDVMPVLRQLSVWVKTEVVPALIRFGGYLAEVVIPVVRRLVVEGFQGFKAGIDNVRTAFQNNKPQLETFIAKIGDIVKWVSEKLGPVLGWLASTQMKLVYGRIALVITAIGKFVTAIQGVITWVKSAGTNISEVWSGVQSASQTALRFVVDKFLGFVGAMIEGAAKAFGWVPGIGPKLRTAATEFGKFRDSVNTRLNGITDQTINVAIKYSSKGVNLTTPSSVGRYAAGGGVFGGTRGKDSVPALLMPDEHVWTTREVQAAGGHGAMQRMREAALRGELHGYAAGGAVGLNIRRPSTAALAKEVAAHALRAAGPYIAAGAKQLAAAGGPPGARRSFRGVTLNQRTIGMLLNAERLLGAAFHITQGSYSTRVAASGSTHAGGGAMDTNGPRGWSLAVRALRAAGFAAWHRTPSQGPWNHHIHSIALGDSSASPAAKAQMASFRRGGNGLGGGMAKGGPVTKSMAHAMGLDTFDTGGLWRSGTIAANTSGRTETVVPGGGAVRLDEATIRAIEKAFARVFGGGLKLRIQGSDAYLLTNSNG